MDQPISAADAAFFSDLSRETHFYLIRHGESEANASRVVQGHLDYPLNARGESQAAVAGQWLADKGITSFSASPLRRAMRTAEIICGRAKIPAPRAEPLFIELETGVFSGLSVEDIQKNYPKEYAEFRGRSWEAVPGAETESELAARALRAWVYLKDQAQTTSGAVAVVTHGGMLQWLVRITFGCGTWMPLLPTGNCGIYHLIVLPTSVGSPAYVQWNRMDYQPGFEEDHVAPVF